jgi:2'-5' RNA ligase
MAMKQVCTSIIERLLQEGKFSCVMAPAPEDLAESVRRWGEMFVEDRDLYTDPGEPGDFGRENEVHVTVKFGLHEHHPSEKLLHILEETQPFEIEVGPCTLFENEKFDVVKFDVDGEGLRELNRRISELPNGDEHAEYKPHMTVAYVMKGSCHELIGKPLLDPAIDQDLRFVVKAVIFSSPDQVKTTLFLGKPNLDPESKRGRN